MRIATTATIAALGDVGRTFGLILLLGVGAMAAPACGGGGGGGGGGNPCALPGVLAALAIEGGAAPDTSGGTYGPFSTVGPTSVAAGGWVAFTADVAGSVTTDKGLFVANPAGVVRLAFARGEAVPAPGSGTIDNFRRIFVTADGIVAAFVDVTGGTTTFGILSARVDGSATVVEKDSVVYSGDLLPPSTGPGQPGTLTGIDDDRIAVTDQGSTFFVGTGSAGGTRGVWGAARDGTGLAKLAKTGDAAPGTAGTFGFGFEAIGIDQDGLLLAFAVDVLLGPASAIYMVDTTTFVTVLVAKDGDVVPDTGGLRTFSDAYDGGPLVVSLLGGFGSAVWQGEMSGPTPNVGIFYRPMTPAVGAVDSFLMPGEPAPNTGGGLVNSIALLDTEIDPNRVTAMATVASGSTSLVFYGIHDASTLTEICRQGGAAPGAGGATFTSTFPSVGVPRSNDTDSAGSLAFSAVLSDASSGIWWQIVNCSFFLVARAGDPAPGTIGAFAPFSAPALVNVAVDTLVFQAFVTGGPVVTGLWRQH